MTVKSRAGSAVLRIGVDARDLLVAQRTGVERLVSHFVSEADAIGACKFVLFFDRAPPLELAGHWRHDVVVEPLRFTALRKLLDTWVLLQLPGALRRNRIDAFISFNTKFPVWAHIPAFATVHGVEWYFYPKGYRLLERFKQRLWFELSSRYCAGIITFSDSSERDIFRIRPGCNVPVCMVPEGCDPIFRRLAAEEATPDVLARYGLSAPYILSVSSLVPRKNVDGLLRAFAKLRHDHGMSHQLALVGKSGWKAEALLKLAAKLGIAEHVRFLGFVADADLVNLYNQAALFVYPSKYEGFGLPLLEAMNCGVPVVTANRSATAEVAGDAALLIDPDSVKEMAEGMRRAIQDEGLRARLVGAGAQRVKAYSWTRMTQEICDFVLARVATTRSSGALRFRREEAQ